MEETCPHLDIMADGYIYCFSNESMPGILKVGMTERTPEIRLGEANASDTWRPPTPYKIEFAKKVSNSIGKEKTLHILLEKYTHRINPRREFFRVSPEEVLKFFELMDGELWVETCVEEEDEEEEEEDEEVKLIDVKACRDMVKCFTNGQRIRHIVHGNIWIGQYNSLKIDYDGISYNSLSSFATAHAREINPNRKCNRNGWKRCECEIDGKWVSTYSLPEIN